MTGPKEFFEAVQKGDLPAVREWLAKDRGLVNARTERGFSPVTVAAYYGKGDVLQEILTHHPTLTLHEAAIVGDLRRVKEFVERDPKLANDASAPDGFPPLGLAAHFGRPEVVRYLLSKGADVNFAAPGIGFTALTGAIAGGHTEVAKLLVAAGANVNHVYEDGRFSVLIAAAAEGTPELVEVLLDAGADPNLRTKDGKTALAMAVEKGRMETADLLRRRGAQ